VYEPEHLLANPKTPVNTVMLVQKGGGEGGYKMDQVGPGLWSTMVGFSGTEDGWVPEKGKWEAAEKMLFLARPVWGFGPLKMSAFGTQILSEKETQKKDSKTDAKSVRKGDAKRELKSRRKFRRLFGSQNSIFETADKTIFFGAPVW
jgi:hypothetical protein